MAAVFISHSSDDRPAADALAAALRARGCYSLFLDSDPQGGIGVGKDWERTLYQELAACQAVVVLLSPTAERSCWVFAEITHARSLGKPLLPARVAACEPPAILADTQIVDLVSDPETGYQRLWEGLQGAGIGASLALPEGRSPYPGLAGFEPADAGVFFGRDDLARSALAELQRLRREGGAQLLLLTGPAGVGKSSLARAGMLPLLRQQSGWLPLEPITPHGKLLAPLQRAVAATCAREDAASALVLEALRGEQPAAFAERLRAACRQPRAAVVLIIDPLERLLAPVEDEPPATDRTNGLLALLLGWLGAGDENLLCVATLRADQRADLDASPLGTLARRELMVPPLEPQALPEIIGRPALVAGAELSAELVVALVEEVRAGAGLARLALALRTLWEQGGGGRLELRRYRELVGDLGGCIDRAAERALDLDRRSAQELEALRTALRQLVRIGAEGHVLPAAAVAERLPEAARPLLQRLASAGLLSGGGPDQNDQEPLALAHSSLTEAWQRLRHWLDEDLELLRWRRRFVAELAAWRRQRRLLRGDQLAEAERWLQSHRADLDPTSIRLIHASRAAVRRRRLLAATATAVIFAALAGLSAYALRQRSAAEQGEAEALAQLATAHRIAAVDQRDRVGDLLLAAHHFAQVAARSPEPAVASSAHRALSFLAGGVGLAGVGELGVAAEGGALMAQGDALIWGPGAALLWPSHEPPGRLALDPSERGLALLTGGEGGLLTVVAERELRLRDLAQPAVVPAKLELPARLGQALPAGDGRAVLAWTRDGRVLHWIPAERSARWLSHGGGVRGVVEAGDGALVSFGSNPPARYWPAGADESTELALPYEAYAAVAVGTEPRVLLVTGTETLVLWEPTRGQQREIPVPRLVDQAMVLADGGFLFWDGAGSVWLLRPGEQQPSELHRHGDALTCVVLSADGSRLATCGLDSPVKLWRFGETASDPLSLRGRCGGCRAAFAPDGATLVTWDDLGRVQRWDTATGQALGLPMRHGGSVGGVIFGEDGRTLLSWGREGDARRWRLAPGGVPALHFPPGAGPLAVTAAGGAGTVLATADGQACEWSTTEAASLDCQHLQAHPGERLDGAVLSSDGSLVAGWRRGFAGLWRTADGALQADLSSPAEAPAPAFPGGHFSADGKRFLLWGESGRSRLWDTARGFELPELWHPGVAEVGSLSADGGWSLLLGDGLARVWRTPAGEQPPQWPEAMILATGALAGAVLSAEGDAALTWREAGQVERWILGPPPSANAVPIAVLSDIAGATASTGGDGVLLWGGPQALLLAGGQAGPALNHRARIVGASVLDDGKLAVTWNDFDARVWDPRSGTPETPLLLHDDRLRGAAFAADGSWLALWSRESLRRWSLVPGEVDGDPVRWLERASGTRLADQSGPTDWRVQVLSASEWQALTDARPSSER